MQRTVRKELKGMNACVRAGVPAVRDDGGRGGHLRDAAGAQHHHQPGGASHQGEEGSRGARQPRRGAAILAARRPEDLALQPPRLHAGHGQGAHGAHGGGQQVASYLPIQRQCDAMRTIELLIDR